MYDINYQTVEVAPIHFIDFERQTDTFADVCWDTFGLPAGDSQLRPQAANSSEVHDLYFQEAAHGKSHWCSVQSQKGLPTVSPATCRHDDSPESFVSNRSQASRAASTSEAGEVPRHCDPKGARGVRGGHQAACHIPPFVLVDSLASKRSTVPAA